MPTNDTEANRGVKSSFWSRIDHYIMKGPIRSHVSAALILASSMTIVFLHIHDGFSYRSIGDWWAILYGALNLYLAAKVLKQSKEEWL